MNPKVSVILYGHNYGRYIGQAVESVLSQSFGDLELIATDNASEDGTQDILRAYAKKDSRVRLMLHRDNVLNGPRWNLPLREAKGEAIALLNADDYFLPEKLRIQFSSLSGLPREVGLVYGPCFRLNDLTGERWLERSFRTSGEALEPMLRDSHREGIFCYHAPLTRREVFERYPFVGDDYFEGEGIFFRFAMKYHFFHLDEPLVVLRDHLSNMGKAIKTNRRVFVIVLNELIKHPDFPPRLLPAWKTFMARHLRNYGWQGVRVAQDSEWARACFREALTYEPLQALHPRLVAGLGLALLPRPVLEKLNSLFNSLFRHKENVKFTEITQEKRGVMH